MIPERAVDEALLAMRRLNFWEYNDADYIRIALEAAAPHMLAAAWDAAYRKGIDDILLGEVSKPSPNPYRPTP